MVGAGDSSRQYIFVAVASLKEVFSFRAWGQMSCPTALVLRCCGMLTALGTSATKNTPATLLPFEKDRRRQHQGGYVIVVLANK
jgi:hypothetical protein